LSARPRRRPCVAQTLDQPILARADLGEAEQLVDHVEPLSHGLVHSGRGDGGINGLRAASASAG
jgi:hypothetical protein